MLQKYFKIFKFEWKNYYKKLKIPKEIYKKPKNFKIRIVNQN